MGTIQRFGRYAVTGTLGSGSMGHVYAAIDDVLGRTVAIKTLRSGVTGFGAQMLDERFRTEARAVAALNHPGIVQVYDIDLSADPPYLVMERLVGPSLRERFQRGPLTPNEVRALGIQIGRALALAHASGIVHRDVKPANILIAGQGTWKLADFGIAHVPDSSLTMTGQFMGSPAYAPPEAMLRGECRPAGDVFGLGATLYHGAAGRWPRLEETGPLLARVPSVRSLVPELPDDLVEIIDRAVEIEPSARPNADELVDRLARAGASSPPRTVSVETEFVPDRAPVSRAHPPDAGEPPASDVSRADAHDDASSTATIPDRRSLRPIAIVVAGLAIAVLIAAFAMRSNGGASARVPTTTVATGAIDAATVAIDAAIAPSIDAAIATASAPDAAAAPEALDALADEDLPPLGEIRALTPKIGDRDALRDWDRIVDALYEQKFEKARDRLDRWEERWGVTTETTSLKRQLERLREYESAQQP